MNSCSIKTIRANQWQKSLPVSQDPKQGLLIFPHQSHAQSQAHLP